MNQEPLVAKFVLPLLLSLVVFGASFAQTPASVVHEVLEFSEDDLSVREIEVGGIVYDALVLEGGQSRDDLEVQGKPDVPGVRLRYLLPPGTTIASLDVSARSSELLPGEYYPNPTQPPVDPDSRSEAPRDEEAYGSFGPYPETMARIHSLGSFRGMMIADVVVYPFRFRAASRAIQLHRTVDVLLHLRALRQDEGQRIPRGAGTRYALTESQRAWLLSAVRNPEVLDAYEPGHDEGTARGSATPDTSAYGAGVVTERPSMESARVPYVVVTDQALEDEFSRLAEWKTRKGVRAEVRTVEWVESEYVGVDTQEKIRNFLIDAYERWGTRWVLLGGDTNVVPPRFMWGGWQTPGKTLADAYYAGLDGSWNVDNDFRFGNNAIDVSSSDPYSDVAVGRVPARDAREARVFVDKLFAYVRHPGTPADAPPTAFYTRFLAFAGMLLDDDWGDELASDENGIYRAHQIGTGSIDRASFGSTILAEHVWAGGVGPTCFGACQDSLAVAAAAGEVQPWTGTSLRSALNSGYGLVYHAEHSSVYAEGGASVCANASNCGTASCRSQLAGVSAVSDADVDLTDEEVLRLTNDDGAYSVVFSWGSNTNAYDLNSISEQWIRNPDGGAIAYIGYSRSVYSESAFGYADSTFFHVLLDDGVHKVGDAFSLAMAELGVPLRARIVHELLGDPEMTVWTTEPDTFSVPSLDPSSLSSLGHQHITVSVDDTDSLAVADARVCVRQSDESYAVGLTDANGEITFFDFNVRDTTVATVTVTKDGFVPVQTAIVPSNNGATVRYSGHTADEVDQYSNGDTVVTAAEDATLSVDLKNVGAGGTGSLLSAKLYASQPISLELLTHDTDYPIKIGASEAEYVETDDGAMWFPGNVSAARAEGEPPNVISVDGIYVWRDPDDKMIWNLAATAGASPRVPGDALRPPLDTIVKWLVEVPDGYPSLHDTSHVGLESGDVVTTTSSGFIVTFTDDSGTGSDTDIFRFRADYDDWLTITADSDMIGLGIASGATETAEFSMSFQDSIPNRQPIVFTTRSTVASSEVGVSDFVVTVDAPVVELLETGFASVAQDTFQLSPAISNTGNAIADLVTLEIQAADPAVTVVSGTTAVSDLSAGSGVTTPSVPLTFTVDTSSVDLDDPLIDLDIVVAFDRAASDELRQSYSGLELDPPGTVSGFQGLTVESGVFRLRWNVLLDGSNRITRYNVYEAPIGSSVYTIVNDALVEGSTTFDIPGTASGLGKKFRVAAVDTAFNEGPLSSEVVIGSPGYAYEAGWPKYVPLVEEAAVPIVANLDASGADEVVVGSNTIYAWTANEDYAPSDSLGVLFEPTAGAVFGSALCVADVDANDGGKLEIVAAATFISQVDTLYVLEHDGEVKFRAHVSARLSPPVVADIDADGAAEVLVASGDGTSTIYAWTYDSQTDTLVPYFSANSDGMFADVTTQYNYGGLSVANLDGGTDLEVIFAAGQVGADAGVLQVFTAYDTSPADDSADTLWTFDTGIEAPLWKPAIADVDDDGDEEVIVAQGDGSAVGSAIHVLGPDGPPVEHTFALADSGVAIGTSTGFGPAVAVGNLDGDDELEVVVGGTIGSNAPGTVPGTSTVTPVHVVDFSSTSPVHYIESVRHEAPYLKFRTNGDYVVCGAVIANIDDDAGMEVILGSKEAVLHFLEWDATNKELVVDDQVPFLLLPGEVDAGPQIGNFFDVGINDDLELLVLDRGGQVTFLDLPSDTTSQSIEWGMFGADLRRTGRYNPIPAQRVPAPTVRAAFLRTTPNPFYESTQFTFSVSSRSELTLSVFDVAGRRVAQLLSAWRDPGVHSLRWDGTGQSGLRLAAGVYFAQLRAGGVQETSRIILLR